MRPNTTTRINKELREAGISDLAFKPRQSFPGRNDIVCINLDADENRPGKITQTMRNIGYVLDGDWGWQLTFRPA